MNKRVGAFILISMFGVGCGVGNDDDGGDDGKVEDNDPNPNGLVCSDAFKVSGTFTASTPRPTVDPNDPASPFTGCWPVGTWNFTVTRDPADTNVLDITGDQKADRCGAVASTQIATFDASYSMVVTRTMDAALDWIDTYSLTGAVPSPSGGPTLWNDKVLYRMKVTEGGGGECEAGIELYSRDGTQYWNMHPALTGTTLNGFGDFYVYSKSQL